MLGKVMPLLANRLVQIVVVAAVCSALAFHKAWVMRGEQKDAEHAAATIALNARLDRAQAASRRIAQLVIAQAEAYAVDLQEIENAARSDPDADRTALPRDSVRRVFSIGTTD